MGDPLSNLFVLAIAVLAAGMFLLSLSEAALLGCNRQVLRRRAQAGDRRAEVTERLVSRGEYLTAIIAGVNTATIGISTLSTLLVWRNLGHGEGWGHEIVHIAVIAALVIFAELTPKSYGTVHADEVAVAVAPWIAGLTRLLGTPVIAVTRLGDAILALAHTPPAGRRHLITEEDIQAVADLGEEAGLVEPEEGVMLDHIIEMGELTARDSMVPRVDVVAISADATLDEALNTAEESGFSRLPVYRESVDNVVGVVHVNDLLRSMLAGGAWQDSVREPLVVAETTPLTEVFDLMRRARAHLVIVADEFGGTAGVATSEDIVEELVGEIRDEHDTAEEDVIPLGETEWMVTGRLRLADLYELIDREAPEEGPDTVAGLLAELTGRIPDTGERVEHEGLVFVVEHSDGQHVDKVRVIAGGAG